MVSGVFRVALERAFDEMRRMLGSPSVYAIPWQTPTGLTYDADLDAWVNNSGEAADPDLYTLTSNTIPALWGADADSFLLAMGGVVTTGAMYAIAKASYQSQLAGAMMVRTGSTAGDKYTVTELENAPDGGGAVFVVAKLQRRES